VAEASASSYASSPATARARMPSTAHCLPSDPRRRPPDEGVGADAPRTARRSRVPRPCPPDRVRPHRVGARGGDRRAAGPRVVVELNIPRRLYQGRRGCPLHL
jgi:hypothetical protein